MSINFLYSLIHSIEVSASFKLENVAYWWSSSPNSTYACSREVIKFQVAGGVQGCPRSARRAAPSSKASGEQFRAQPRCPAPVGPAGHGQDSLLQPPDLRPRHAMGTCLLPPPAERKPWWPGLQCRWQEMGRMTLQAGHSNNDGTCERSGRAEGAVAGAVAPVSQGAFALLVSLLWGQPVASIYLGAWHFRVLSQTCRIILVAKRP